MTEELGQQSLLEKPKPQALIVPRGATSWWGVDGSTRGVAIGVVNGAGERRWVWESTPATGGLSRLRASYASGRAAALTVLGYADLPGLVVIEQPSGSNQQVNHELEMAVGCLIAGVLDELAVQHVQPHSRLVVASWWKKAGCGSGAIKKTKKVPGRKRSVMLGLEEYEVMKWARLNGYTGSSWDEADAGGMAEAARLTWDLVER